MPASSLMQLLLDQLPGRQHHRDRSPAIGSGRPNAMAPAPVSLSVALQHGLLTALDEQR